MADLFIISPGLGKVYRFDGSTWTLFANAPVTWQTAQSPDGMFFVHRGKLYAFVTYSATRMDLFRLESGGTWTSILTGTARTAYEWFGPAARYRGRIYIFTVVPPANGGSPVQLRLLEWDGSSLSGDNAATGLWLDRDGGGSGATQDNRPRGIIGRIEGWRERLLLGQWVNFMKGPIPTNESNHSNYLHAIDPTSSAVLNSQQLLGGPDGVHSSMITFWQDGTNDTLEEVIYRSHVGYGVYRGKIYLLGVDGGVRELSSTGIVTTTPIFSFKSAFTVQGPYTASTANPIAAGLSISETAGGYLAMRNLIQGAEVTCEGRVGIVTGWNDDGVNRSLRLRDAVTGVELGNFSSGASYTFKQGLGWNANLVNTFYGAAVQATFHVYNGKMYVFICGTQRVAVAGTTCPSLLACWDGATASFVAVLYASAILDAAGANVHVDPDTGIMHIVYYTYISLTSVSWKHVTVNLATLAVGSTTTIATESGWSTTGSPTMQGLGICASVLFTHDLPTAEVTATSYDPLRNVMTVTYYLYDDSSSPCDITVQTDYGSGWFECTRKGVEGEGKTLLSSSSSGVLHTFVHDMGADGSPAFNRVQYLINATESGT